MEKICNTKVTIPELLVEPCNGKYTSSDCVFTAKKIPYLAVNANAPITEVFSTLILALQYKDQQIENLQQQINDITNV